MIKFMVYQLQKNEKLALKENIFKHPRDKEEND